MQADTLMRLCNCRNTTPSQNAPGMIRRSHGRGHRHLQSIAILSSQSQRIMKNCCTSQVVRVTHFEFERHPPRGTRGTSRDQGPGTLLHVYSRSGIWDLGCAGIGDLGSIMRHETLPEEFASHSNEILSNEILSMSQCQ